MLDLTSSLHSCSVFNKISLVRAYHQIPVNQPDITKTTVTTPFGLVEFVCMPFGMCNSAQTFQRFIHEVCRGLDFVYPYLDDIFVASNNAAEHWTHLRALLSRLTDHGVTINADKCQLGEASITFLGHNIFADGVRLLSEKMKDILDYPKPQSFKQLRRFDGLVNFYRRSIPNCEQLVQPLTDLLLGNQWRFLFTDESHTAFGKLKFKVAEHSLLNQPNRSALLSLSVGTSSTAIGAALQQ